MISDCEYPRNIRNKTDNHIYKWRTNSCLCRLRNCIQAIYTNANSFSPGIWKIVNGQKLKWKRFFCCQIYFRFTITKLLLIKRLYLDKTSVSDTRLLTMSSSTIMLHLESAHGMVCSPYSIIFIIKYCRQQSRQNLWPHCKPVISCNKPVGLMIQNSG